MDIERNMSYSVTYTYWYVFVHKLFPRGNKESGILKQ